MSAGEESDENFFSANEEVSEIIPFNQQSESDQNSGRHSFLDTDSVDIQFTTTDLQQETLIDFNRFFELDVPHSSSARRVGLDDDFTTASTSNGQTTFNTAVDDWSSTIVNSSNSENALENTPSLSADGTVQHGLISEGSTSHVMSDISNTIGPVQDEQQEIVAMEQSEDDEDLLDYNEDRDELDSSTDDDDDGELANLDRWDDNQGVGVLATDDTGELRLLTGTGANYYVDQRRRNMGLQNLFNYIRRRAFRRSGERVREIDDANVPGLSVDQIQNMNFDRSLPERHQYLGDDMEVIAGRTVHEEKDVLVLPFMRQVSHVLLPKQSMPMYFNRQRDVALLRRVLSGDKTFVILPLPDRSLVRSFHPADSVGKIAVVAEVVMSAEDDEDNFKVIAEARQRCRILDFMSSHEGDGVRSLKIQILPDNNLHYNLFRDIDKFSALQFEFSRSRPSKCQQYYYGAVRLPSWTIESNNVYSIMYQIRTILRQLFKNESGMAKLVEDPSDFSFLVASFLPLSNRVKLKLLDCSCALHRLKLELEFLRRSEYLFCSICSAKLASVSEVIVMSNTGALASYVNPGGVIYETLTLNKISGKVNCVGRPQTENSWFPGYAWTPASCNGCHSHLGWLFTRARGAPQSLKPARFWGLSHSALSLDADIERRLLNMPTSTS